MSSKSKNLFAIMIVALVGFAVINLFSSDSRAAAAAVLP